MRLWKPCKDILDSLFSVSQMFRHHALLGLGQTLNFSWQGRSLDFSRAYAHFPKSLSPHQKFQIVLRCLVLRWGYVGSHERVFTVEMTLSKPTCKRTRARRWNVWPVSNFAHKLPNTRNKKQQSVKTDATYNIQQHWAKNVPSVRTGLNKL